MEDRFENTLARFGSPRKDERHYFYSLRDRADAEGARPSPEAGPRESADEAAPNDRCMLLVGTYFAEGPEAFALLVDRLRSKLVEECLDNKVLKRIVVTGLEIGIAENCAACANQLGAFYYSGQIVSQDYKAARDLYELAMSLGSMQAAINLGYVYEYGRTAQPDHKAAYRCYSYAAALRNAPEALYKMGDVFSRGKAFDKDARAAFKLWSKSFHEAELSADVQNQAQAALRMAPYYLRREKASEAGIETGALHALKLYQIAEVGIRISIDGGLAYYEKRLRQAIEGQERALLALDGPFTM